MRKSNNTANVTNTSGTGSQNPNITERNRANASLTARASDRTATRSQTLGRLRTVHRAQTARSAQDLGVRFRGSLSELRKLRVAGSVAARHSGTAQSGY